MIRTLVVVSLLSLSACAPQSSSPRVDQQPLTFESPDDVHVAFRAWVDAWLSAPPEARADLEARGAPLLAARRDVMRTLIATEPQRALALAVSPVIRDALPPELAAHVEQWRDGRGEFAVICGLVEEGNAPLADETWVSFAGDSYSLRASVFGRREGQLSNTNARLHGVELDGFIALTESPLRRLEPGEARAALPVETPYDCGSPDQLLHGGDVVYAVCGDAQAHALEASLEEEPPASAWTEGPKTLLFVRVDFSDRVGDPIAQGSAETLINTTVNNYFIASSYNLTTYSTTVTPTFRLPWTRATYLSDAGSYIQLRQHALALATDAGYVVSSYSNDAVGFASVYSGWAGRGYVGSRGTWLNGSFTLRTTAHELGHNYGSQHANAWNTSLSPIDPGGSSIEYGNPFDIMGGGGGVVNHITAWNKSRFNWLAPMATPTVMTSGTYRLQALEPVVSTGIQGLRIARNAQRAYWLEFRPAINSANARDGIEVNWDGPDAKAHLLDMTPGDGNRNNAPLIIGRTFSDTAADIHITPVAKVATTPEAVDVVINLGAFPGNRAPTVSLMASATSVATNAAVTFTASASDPDGDTLAYAWDFDDATWGPNATMATKSWTMARTYNVRLTVSDMKGQTASASVLVTVGAPTTYTLEGTVTFGGQPLADVRINDGTRTTFTTTDGTWRLTNVPAGSFTINAAKIDYAFTRSFAAPLTVSASQTGLDFSAALGAGNSISGTVSAGGMPRAGVTVTDGSRTATTNASGNYTLTGVRSGAYTLTATQPGWQFNPNFTNPVEVMGSNVTARNFNATGYTMNGAIPAASVATAPVVTDGVRSVTATRSGSNWTWFLQSVPNGQWNVTATSPGVTLTPGNFTNPVTISNAGRSNLNFSVTTTTTFRVSGTVTTGGTPLPGVVVSDGTRSATTDSLGSYTLVGVPAGAYTLTPTLSGYSFTPATLMVNVVAADLTGQNFTTTVVNAPPTIAMNVVATPSPVTTGTTTAVTVLGADDTGEAQLTYTWSAAGAYPVTFSASGTNGAKSATATFSGGGTYNVQCVIRDPGGLSVTASAMVQVQQVASGLTVTPPSANVMTGALQNFVAQGVDQFGRFMSVSPVAWSVSGGGTISGTGNVGAFTAGAMAGGPHTVTAVAGGRTATASVTVTGTGAPTITTPASATPNPVTGTTTRLSVRATDDAGEAGLEYRWNLTSGPASVTYSANNSNAAKNSDVTFTEVGIYDFVVAVVDGAGNMANSAVTVTVQATPTRIDVQPAVVVLRPAETQTFTAAVYDQFDAQLSSATVTWTVSGGGVIDASGEFTAGATEGGPFSVTATLGSVTDAAQVTIMAAPDTEAPTVAIDAPTGGTTVTGMTTVTATASDNIAVVGVEFFVDATSLGEVTVAPYAATLDVATLSVGSHALTARARDAAGNLTTSAVVTVLVGVVDSAAPTVSITSPGEGATTSLQVSVSVTASDDVGVTRVDLELDGVIAQSLSAQPWVSGVTVTAGAHTLAAIAHDASGKSTRSAVVNFVAEGAVVQPDAGTVVDGGVVEPTPPPEMVSGGCGCTAVDVPGVLVFALVGLLRRRRRD